MTNVKQGQRSRRLNRRMQKRTSNLSVLFVTGSAEREALTGICERLIVSKPFVTDAWRRTYRLALAGETRVSA